MPSRSRSSPQQLEHLGLDRDVQRAGRLVGQQHLRAQRQGQRDRHPLQLAAGQLAGVAAQQVRGQQHLRIAAASRSVASLPASPCWRSARARWADRNTGLNAVAGLWKIAAIRRPRRSRYWPGDSPVSSWPSSVMLPATLAPAVCARPSTASVVIDLPDPLSPASPTISACADRQVGRCPRRPGRRSGPSARAAPASPQHHPPRVELVPQPVAEQVEAERGDQDGQAGEGDQPPGGGEVRLPLATIRPQSGVGSCAPRPRNDSAEAVRITPPTSSEICTISGVMRVGQDVPEDDPAPGNAQRPAGFHVRARRPPTPPGRGSAGCTRATRWPRSRSSRWSGWAAAPRRGPAPAAAPGRPGNVGDPHDHVVQPAAEVAGHDAQRDADQRRRSAARRPRSAGTPGRRR